jgi:NAD-dependent deacetylase
MGREDEAFAVVAGWLRDAGRVVVFTGAGISTESGIPDFRGPNGVWKTRDPLRYTIQNYLADAEVRRESWQLRLSSAVDAAQPNAGHRAVAALEESGRVTAVVTQNIDGLHEAAGVTDLIEVHGSISHASCLVCGEQHELEEVRARLDAAADGVPRCDQGHPLKPDVVLFGEFLPEAALARASALAANADLLICIGSSLEVYPIAQLPQITLAAGGSVALVTKGPTPYDSEAEVKLDGDVVDELQAVVAAL